MQNNEHKLVSCIITTCKRGRILSRAIESVLNQTYMDIELIVIDDCPCAETENIVNIYLQDNPKMQYIKNEKNLGPSGARNKGVSVSNGEYIAFLDDDDEWLAEKIAKQIKFIKNAHIICNPPYFRHRNDQSLHEIIHKDQKSLNECEQWSVEDLYYDFSAFYPSGSLLSKNAYTSVDGFDERLTRGEFWDLLLKMTNNKNIAVSCSEKLVVFDRTVRDDRVSQNGAKNEDTFTVLERFRPFVSNSIYLKRKTKLLLKRFKELNDWADIFAASKLSPSLTIRFVLQHSKSFLKKYINKCMCRFGMK
jgi:glycosyltransferase involved in cell wall biosynthesis